jgi:hypothetical protein
MAVRRAGILSRAHRRGFHDRDESAYGGGVGPTAPPLMSSGKAHDNG